MINIELFFYCQIRNLPVIREKRMDSILNAAYVRTFFKHRLNFYDISNRLCKFNFADRKTCQGIADTKESGQDSGSNES